MEKRRLFTVFLLTALLLCFWLWIRESGTEESAEAGLTITAFSVGKADALLLQEGDTAMLVDTGEADDGSFLIDELKKRGVERLDLLLVTHFDKDHVGSASYIMEHMEVERVMMPDYEGERPEYRAFAGKLSLCPDVRRLTVKEQFTLGELKWMIYPAEDPDKIQDTDGEYDNDMSLVASVAYGDRSFLLTGDIEKTRIGQMLASDEDWEHDWMKMPHHGRYQKSVKELLDAVRPEYAVICCSLEEPAEEKTLEALRERKIQAWDTSAQTVVTVCDGVHIKIYQQ